MDWFVYMLLCADGSFYTGISNDVARRAEAHNAARGAKYTRSRLPVKVVYCERCADRSAALRREAAVKKLSHAQKHALTGGVNQTSASAGAHDFSGKCAD